MIHLLNRTAEDDARAYCIRHGMDPNALVVGYDHRRFPQGQRVSQPRWQWYVGVSEAALRRPI